MPKAAASSPIAKAPTTDVARDAATLRRLLERSIGTADWRETDVKDGSEHVRAFWETIGWSPLFASKVEPPETSHGLATAKQLMASYASEKHFRLRLRDLPKAYRIVHVDSQGLGFMLTESVGADPPLMVLSEQKSTLTIEPRSYLAHCAAELLDLAFRRYYRTTFRAKGRFDFGGTALLPVLAPEVRELAEGVWLSTSKKGPTIHHASTEALIAWLRSLPAGTRVLMDLEHAGAVLDVTVSTKKKLKNVHLLKNAEDGFTYELGTAEGIAVMYWSDPYRERPQLLVGPKQRQRFAGKALSKRREDTELASVFDTNGLRKPPALEDYEAGALRKAIEQLATLLDTVPLHKTTRRALEIEREAPRDVRLLWENVGWSDLTKRACMCPERAVSEAEARSVLGRWMQDASTRDEWGLSEGADPLALPVFPHRWRLVHRHLPRKEHDHLIRDSYLVLTEESDKSPDPALFEVQPGYPQPLYLPKRYVAHVARELFTEAFR
jgi:hypothetical protein